MTATSLPTPSAKDRIVDAIDIETFFYCKDESEAKQLANALMAEMSLPAGRHRLSGTQRPRRAGALALLHPPARRSLPLAGRCSARAVMKKVLLAPLDPVHDNAVKLIQRKLKDYDYQTILMPPGTTVEEVVHTALEEKPSAILVSRTLGYQVAETLSRLVDLAEAAGIRQTARLGVGGMAITREIGAELGFDATFVGELKMIELLSFLENRKIEFLDGDTASTENQQKPDITAGYTYQFKDSEIESLLDSIAGQALHWASTRSSDGIKRAQFRQEMLAAQSDTHLAQFAR